MQGDEVVYEPQKPSSFVWQSEEELKAFSEEEKKMNEWVPGDSVVLASFLDDSGFTVAAMDKYRAYFKKNPEDFEMRPMLIKTYHDLRLMALKEREVSLYNNWLETE